jgi:hypothetical protein
MHHLKSLPLLALVAVGCESTPVVSPDTTVSPDARTDRAARPDLLPDKSQLADRPVGADRKADAPRDTGPDWPAVTPCGGFVSLRCKTATEVCVDRWFGASSCEPVPNDCKNNRTCACLAPYLCLGLFDICHDVPTRMNTIVCECPACL